MFKIKQHKHRWEITLATVGLTALSLVGLGGVNAKAAWQTVTAQRIYVNHFSGGSVSTNIDPNVSDKTGKQFNNSYQFDGHDGTAPGDSALGFTANQAYIYQNSINQQPSTLATGTTSGLLLDLPGAGGATFNNVSNAQYQVDEQYSGGGTAFKFTAQLSNGVNTINYEVITSVSQTDGTVKHDVTISNANSTPLPANLVMDLDTQLNGIDSVPLYSTNQGTAAYMLYNPNRPDDALKLKLQPGAGITTTKLGLYNSYSTATALVPGTTPDDSPVAQNVDTGAFYVFGGTNGLTAADGPKTFTYSERLIGSTVTGTDHDESGNVIGNGSYPEIDIPSGQSQTVTPNRVPGYAYRYAYAVNSNGDRVAVFHDAQGNLVNHTVSNPVTAWGVGSNYKLVFVHRPVDNKDTYPNKPTNPEKPTQPTPPTNPENPTTPETPNTPEKPSVVAKGQAIYNIQKIGLYRGVNFSYTNRIKSYAKRIRINRYEFIVKGYGHSKTGALRYYVQEYNPYKNQYIKGTKGYITASAKYVLPVYYKTVGQTKRIKVINPKGVKAYANKQLTTYKHLYKRGMTLKVKRVVTQKYTTRYQLTNGWYVTANKKFVMATK